MRVLMLSRDSAGLDRDSAPARRWMKLAAEGIDLEVIIASRGSGEWESEGIRVVGTGGGFFSRFLRAFRIARDRAGVADLVTAQDPFELGLVAWRAARKNKRPFEIQDHAGLYGEEIHDEPLWFLRKYIARFLAARADLVRTVNPKSFEMLDRKRRGRSYLLPIAVDDRFFAAAHRPEPGQVVTVSRLIGVKRVDLLLRAFAAALKNNEQLRLSIVGDGPLKSRLISLTRELGIDDVVRFVGHADPLPYLERATLFVLLSRHEGWGVAPAEAAAVGVPVLMTDTGSARWLKERSGAEIVGIETTAEEISEAILRALERRDKRPDMGELRMARAISEQARVWQEFLSVIK